MYSVYSKNGIFPNSLLIFLSLNVILENFFCYFSPLMGNSDLCFAMELCFALHCSIPNVKRTHFLLCDYVHSYGQPSENWRGGRAWPFRHTVLLGESSFSWRVSPSKAFFFFFTTFGSNETHYSVQLSSHFSLASRLVLA